MKKVLRGIEKISMGTQEIEVRPTSASFGFKVCCWQRNCTKIFFSDAYFAKGLGSSPH